MKEMHFAIQINAPKERVWTTLWQDETFREWAGMIDPGTYMIGKLEQGNSVQFISSENGYGVTSLVEKVITNEHLLLRHSADTQESGTENRDNEWTGGTESYSLLEMNGVTQLNITLDVPFTLENVLAASYPRALARIKSLAESF